MEPSNLQKLSMSVLGTEANGHKKPIQSNSMAFRLHLIRHVSPEVFIRQKIK